MTMNESEIHEVVIIFQSRQNCLRHLYDWSYVLDHLSPVVQSKMANRAAKNRKFTEFKLLITGVEKKGIIRFSSIWIGNRWKMMEWQSVTPTVNAA